MQDNRPMTRGTRRRTRHNQPLQHLRNECVFPAPMLLRIRALKMTARACAHAGLLLGADPRMCTYACYTRWSHETLGEIVQAAHLAQQLLLCCEGEPEVLHLVWWAGFDGQQVGVQGSIQT